MDYKEQNLEVLKNIRPLFYEAYEEYLKDATEADIEVSKVETRDGNYALCVQCEDQLLRLNSAYRPVDEAKRWADAYEFPNICTIIEMYGLGNGVFVRELLKKVKEDDSLIIYEPSPSIFSYCISNFKLDDILQSDNVYLYVEKVNEKDIIGCISKKLQWYNLNSHVELEHPFYIKFTEQQHNWYRDMISSNKDAAIINKNTDANLGKASVNNVLKNLKHMIGSNIIADIKGKIPKNVPAIIVSAGPSLSKNIKELKNAKGKSVIFAVDTALPYLEQNGIEPDFIVTIDPKKSNRHFTGKYIENIPVIAKLEAKPDVLDKSEGRKFFYSSHTFFGRLYREVGIEIEDYTSGGSVATAAFSVCVALEFERIILVGQDLAYDGEYTHVGDRTQKQVKGLGIREVDGVFGKPVKTRYDWLIYLEWFENSIFRFPQIDCIDATEGGALIHGSKVMKLSEAIDSYCTESFELIKVIEQTKPSLDTEKQQKVSLYLHEAYDDLDDIRNKSDQILRWVHKMIDVYKKKGINKEINDLTEKIKAMSLEIEEKNIYSIYDTYMTEFANKQMSDIFQMNQKEEDDTLKTFYLTRDMYEYVIEVSKELEPGLLDAIEEFDQRMEK